MVEEVGGCRQGSDPVIVDFQHHFTPRELFKDDPGDRRILQYDVHDAPSYISHRMLFDLDEHIRMMDFAGIDAAVLTSGAGMCADLERSRFINDKVEDARSSYPGRFIGAAHVHPLGGAEAFPRTRARCSGSLAFKAASSTSEVDGLFLDAPEFEAFLEGSLTFGNVRVCASRRCGSMIRDNSTRTTRRAR